MYIIYIISIIYILLNVKISNWQYLILLILSPIYLLLYIYEKLRRRIK